MVQIQAMAAMSRRHGELNAYSNEETSMGDISAVISQSMHEHNSEIDFNTTPVSHWLIYWLIVNFAVEIRTIWLGILCGRFDSFTVGDQWWRSIECVYSDCSAESGEYINRILIDWLIAVDAGMVLYRIWTDRTTDETHESSEANCQTTVSTLLTGEGNIVENFDKTWKSAKSIPNPVI